MKVTPATPKQKLWGKRLIFIIVVIFLIMSITGQMDLNHPFAYYCSESRTYGIEARGGKCSGINNEEVLIFLLYATAGSLMWHFADERKK